MLVRTVYIRISYPSVESKRPSATKLPRYPENRVKKEEGCLTKEGSVSLSP